MAVRFADVDHAGIVYYPTFFHYFHVALEELLRQRLGPRGYVALLDQRRIGFPSVNAQCEFKSPLRFGDTIDIDMSVDRLGNKSIAFRFRVYRRGDQPGSGEDDRVLAAEGTSVSAVVDLDAFQAISVPSELVELFRPLVGSAAGARSG